MVAVLKQLSVHKVYRKTRTVLFNKQTLLVIYETSNLNLFSMSLLSDDVKVNITIDAIRPTSNFITNKTVMFTEISFFRTIIGFTQSQASLLDDSPQEFVQMILGSYRSKEPIKITGIDKVLLKYDYFNSSNVNGEQERILLSFAQK